MVKKVKKKKTKKKTSHKKAKTEVQVLQDLDAREKILVSNFVALQKVLTNLSSNIDEMTTKMDKLLNVFEISAKALAENDVEFTAQKNDKEVLERLDTLADQNKIIAKGLTMLHDKEGEEKPMPPTKPLPSLKPMAPPQKIPQFRPMAPPQSRQMNQNIPKQGERYQASRNLQQPGQPQMPKMQTPTTPPKPLPQNPNMQSATQGYKSTTQGEDLEQPSPPEDNSPMQ